MIKQIIEKIVSLIIKILHNIKKKNNYDGGLKYEESF